MAQIDNRLTQEDVLRIAQLANLTLKDTEIEKLQTELSSILSYISKLNEIDTTNTPATNQVTGLKNILREDKALPENVLIQEEALSNAPKKNGNYFEVDAIFDND